MDQAERLRDLVRKNDNGNPADSNKAIKIYTIFSGKGGVGKTNIAVNLAIALQKKGKKVLIIDADLGMANVDVILGIYTRHTIYDVLFHNYPLKDTVVTCFDGIKILPGGSGMLDLAELDIRKQEEFARQFMAFNDIDIILIDTGAGITRNSLSFIAFSQELILVTTPEPTAMTDAYSAVKIITQNNLVKNVKVIVNRCSDAASGDCIYERLNNTTRIFLNKTLERLGYVYDDDKVIKAVMNQTPFLIQYPDCSASRCVKRIADELLGCSEKANRIYGIQQVYKRLMKIFG